MATKVSEEVSVNQEKEARLSARKKADAVIRVLKGESIDAVSRSIKVPAHLIAQWRDEFLAAGTQALKVRTTRAEDRRELKAAQAKVGELTMKIEVLEEFFRKKGASATPPDVEELLVSPRGESRPVCEALRVERGSYYSAKGEREMNVVPAQTDDHTAELC